MSFPNPRSVDVGDSFDYSNCKCLLHYRSFHLVEALAVSEKQMFSSLGPMVDTKKEMQRTFELFWLAKLFQLRRGEACSVTCL